MNDKLIKIAEGDFYPTGGFDDDGRYSACYNWPRIMIDGKDCQLGEVMKKYYGKRIAIYVKELE
jgi:hypothetical protein